MTGVDFTYDSKVPDTVGQGQPATDQPEVDSDNKSPDNPIEI